MRRIRLWLNNRKNRFQDAVHNELLYQVKGLITGVIDDYLCPKGLCAINWEFEDNDEIDAYIIDKSFEENGKYEDICSLAHLHSDDLLWYIINQEEYNKKIIKRIENYMKYRRGEK